LFLFEDIFLFNFPNFQGAGYCFGNENSFFGCQGNNSNPFRFEIEVEDSESFGFFGGSFSIISLIFFFR
jgi:hypothetical protein